VKVEKIDCIRLILAGLVALFLAACQADGEGQQEPELDFRVFELDGNQVEEITGVLIIVMRDNEIPGSVSHAGDSRLVVYSKPQFHEQVAGLLGDLDPAAETAGEQVGVTVRYWALTMRPGVDDIVEIPEIESALETIADRFPRHGLKLHDYLEFETLTGSDRGQHVRTASGARAQNQRVHALDEGFRVRAHLHFPSDLEADQSPPIQYHVEKQLRSGQASVVARTLAETDEDGAASYQVLVARLDVVDEAD